MTITLTLAWNWDKDVLRFLNKMVTGSDHPFVMLTVEPGEKVLSMTSSIGAKSNMQLYYAWRLLDNPATKVMRNQIKVSGLSNILGKLKYGLPIKMTTRGEQISLESEEHPDLFSDFLLEKNRTDYCLLDVADNNEHSAFDMRCVNKTLSVKFVATELGHHLEVAGKFLKLSPLNIGEVPNLHLYFTRKQVSIQGQVGGDTVSIIQSYYTEAHSPSEPFVSRTVAIAPELAVKVASLLKCCSGYITVSLLDDFILIERDDWSLLINLARVTRDGQVFEKQFDEREVGCKLQIPKLLNKLSQIAIADYVQKELLHVMTHDHTHPNCRDEFMLDMNQDYVSATSTIKMPHPLTPDLNICCNLANLQLVLNSLPTHSRWIYLAAQQALSFYDDEKTMRFVMGCQPSRLNNSRELTCLLKS